MSVNVHKLRISKGFQITVPSDLREKYNLAPSDEIEIVDLGESEGLVMRIPKKEDVRLGELQGFCKVRRKTNSVKEHDKR